MILEGFFTPRDELSPDNKWEAYGPEHLIWLGAIMLVIIVSCYFFKKASPEKQEKILKGLAIWVLIQEILKDIAFYAIGSLEVGHLPLHLCGISIFFNLWYAYKPGDINSAYIYGLSLPGALCALLFPDWMIYPLFHFSALNSFTIHGEHILFAMLALTSGRLIPDIRTLPKLFGVLLAMALPIYFLNKIWDTNFMFLNTPSPGSPLIPLYALFGEGYVIALGVIVVIVWLILFLPWYFIKKKNTKNALSS